MRFLHSATFLSASALIGAAFFASTFAACSDLAIAPQTEGGAGNEGGTTGDGGIGSDSAAPLDCGDGGKDHPTDLGCTGLYSDWPSRTIAADALAYDPGLHFWADGADESRYIAIPAGQKIDTTDLNEWKFPVGTKIWQELRLAGRPLETRYVNKVGAQTWFRTTYAWSDDGSQATELTYGNKNAHGLGYEILSTDSCNTCHSSRKDFVLGFEIVALSTSRATGINMDQLTAKGLLTANPSMKPVIPGDAVTVGAFGFIHSNCGIACHNRGPSSGGGTMGLFLRLDVDTTGALTSDRTQTDIWKTTVDVASSYQAPGVDAGTYKRVTSHDPSTSSMSYMTGRRDSAQMPPLSSHLVDFDDLKKMNDWITALP
jgi:hypothetical protein